jgi:thioredoxin-like negative regulator of GroEL
MISRITGKEFAEEVLKSSQPVLVCFTGSQCEVCFPLCLIINSLVEEYNRRLKFVRIDADIEPDLIERYRIRALPSTVLFKDSKPVSKLIGFHHKASVRRWLDRFIGGTQCV